MSKEFVIGVDLGGTNTVFGIVDKEGNILKESSIPTKAFATADEFADAGAEAVRKMLGESGISITQIQGMGIGAPNGNYHTGEIVNAANLRWKGIVPLGKMMTERLGIKTVVTNDANAAAIGEMKYGVAKGMNDFIEITLGTGVGSGIVANGQLIYGHDGFAGELGHVIHVRGKEGRPCGCGRTGCLECYCSATGVARTAKEMLTNTDKPSSLRDIPLEQLTSADVGKAAANGDSLAKEVMDFTGTMLGEACADYAAFSSPEAFIFFGGLVRAGDLIMKPIEKAYNENALSLYKGKPKFLVSSLMDKNAAVLGAAALGW